MTGGHADPARPVPRDDGPARRLHALLSDVQGYLGTAWTADDQGRAALLVLVASGFDTGSLPAVFEGVTVQALKTGDFEPDLGSG